MYAAYTHAPMASVAAMVPNLTTYYDNNVLLVITPLHRHQ